MFSTLLSTNFFKLKNKLKIVILSNSIPVTHKKGKVSYDSLSIVYRISSRPIL